MKLNTNRYQYSPITTIADMLSNRHFEEHNLQLYLKAHTLMMNLMTYNGR